VAILKKLVQRVLGTRGWVAIPEWRLSQLPHERHLSAVFAAYAIDCVLDVGGNLGQFRDLLRDGVGYTGPILSFEPVRQYIEGLEKRAAHDPAWRILPYALGSVSQTRTITLFSSPGLPSLLQADLEAMKQVLPHETAVTGSEDVRIRRLDEVFAEATAGVTCRRVFMKLDTQGYDLEVLKGAGAALESISAIQTELSMLPIYHGMPDAQTAIESLKALGYEISGFFPVTHDRDLRVVEMDGVFVKKKAGEVPPTGPI
jgi:FkbM family methyltransferase